MFHQAAQLPWWSAIAVIVVLAPVAALAVWLIPRRQRDRWKRLGLEDKDVAELEVAARSTVVQLVGGVALILTFVATWVQISDTRKATERAAELTEAQQETEHFTQAVEQLASPKLGVRVGGIYALQQVAARKRATKDETQSRRETVARLMIAFLKSNGKPPSSDQRIEELEGHLKRKPQYVFCDSPGAIPPPPDIQAALTVLFGLSDRDPELRPPALEQLDLAYADLAGVRLEGKDLSNANLRRASLAGAKLSKVNFNNAQLSGADLRGACLKEAHFQRTNVSTIKAKGADFSRADLATARYLDCKYLDDKAITEGADFPQDAGGCDGR